MVVGVFWCIFAQGTSGLHVFAVWRQNEPVLENAGVHPERAAFHAKIRRGCGFHQSIKAQAQSLQKQRQTGKLQ